MTAPGALPAKRSVYEAPAVARSEMTARQKDEFAVAQVAAIIAAAGVAKAGIANQTTLLLVPLLRSMDPENAEEVAAFARKAAQLIDIGRQEVAKVSWASVRAQLAAYDVVMPADYKPVGKGRKTALEYAYRRPAAEYRRRIAAGVESIKGLIAQTEEERFQQLGGAEVAKGRTGESNAKVEGSNRSLGASKGASSKAGSGSNKASGASSGSKAAAEGGSKPKPLPKDKPVNTTVDDWDAEDAAETAARAAEESAQDDADAAAIEAEAELRRQAALTEEQQERLLEQQAQHDMEVRMERMVNDDMAIASRQGNQDAMLAAPAGSITAYRRVIHPEMSETGVCGLCVAASDRVYRVKELMPIHNLCKCDVAPIIRGQDPGSQINEEDLATMYEEAGMSTAKQDLINQKYKVFNHPELGPVLRNQKHSISPISYTAREPKSARK